ncbi:MAG: hypothetical protein EZS28_038870, partial [Streblomastix strix]
DKNAANLRKQEEDRKKEDDLNKKHWPRFIKNPAKFDRIRGLIEADEKDEMKKEDKKAQEVRKEEIERKKREDDDKRAWKDFQDKEEKKREQKEKEAKERELKKKQEEEQKRLEEEQKKIKDAEDEHERKRRPVERRQMLYEDELSFYVRKPLSEMMREQLRLALPALRSEDQRLVKLRVDYCRKRLAYIEERLKDIKHDELIAQVKAEEAKTTFQKDDIIEREKKNIRDQRKSLDLKLSSLRKIPYRKYYDRDMNEKFGPKEKDTVFLLTPSTGEKEAKETGMPTDYDKNIVLLNDDKLRKVQTEEEEALEKERKGTIQKMFRNQFIKVANAQRNVNVMQTMMEVQRLKNMETQKALQMKAEKEKMKKEQKEDWFNTEVESDDEQQDQNKPKAVLSEGQGEVQNLESVMQAANNEIKNKPKQNIESEDKQIWDVLEEGSDELDRKRAEKEKLAEEEKQKRMGRYDPSALQPQRRFRFVLPWEEPTVPPRPYPIEHSQLDDIKPTSAEYKYMFDDTVVISSDLVVDADLQYKQPHKVKAITVDAELRQAVNQYKDALKKKDYKELNKVDDAFTNIFTNRAVVSKVPFLFDEELVQLLMSIITEKPQGVQLRYIYSLTLLSRKPQNHPAFIKYKAVDMILYLIKHYQQAGVATLAVAEAIAFLSVNDTIRPQFIEGKAFDFMMYVLRNFS